MTTLLLSTSERAEIWRRAFAEAGETLWTRAEEVPDPARVEHIACWIPPDDIGRYGNLRTVLSIGAGVDHMPALPDGVALVRTLAPGIERMVRDYAVMAALALHRDLPHYLEQSRLGSWAPRPATRAEARRIGVMGMGRIGSKVAGTLAELGFPVAGWSRSGAARGGVTVHGGSDLGAFLARTDLLICLLPLTAETRGILGADTFAALPRGARLVHAGRGGHLDMEALLGALDSGQLAAAMLDVTEPEPLPEDHPAWRHPRLLVTPHVASFTDPAEGAAHALAVVRAVRAGAPVPGHVDVRLGY